jgi:hypothetical protein
MKVSVHIYSPTSLLANTFAGLAEYTKALAFTGQLHANSFKDIRTTPVAAATAAEATEAAKVEGAEEVSCLTFPFTYTQSLF